MKSITDEKVSISVTPDGFADSIKNEYFVEPMEVVGEIRDVINWREMDEKNLIKDN